MNKIKIKIDSDELFIEFQYEKLCGILLQDEVNEIRGKLIEYGELENAQYIVYVDYRYRAVVKYNGVVYSGTLMTEEEYKSIDYFYA